MRGFLNKRMAMLKPEQIRQSKYQPRTSFKEGELKSLAGSISLLGVIEPISVRKLRSGYEIISGERRLRAAVMAGLRRVPCTVYNISEKQAAFLAVSENSQHKPLSYFDEARSISNLLVRYRLTVGEAGLRLGLSENEINSKLRLLRLDEALQRKIIAAGLVEEYARQLLRLDEFSREEIFTLIVKERLNLAQCEEMIDGIINPQKRTDSKEEDVKNAVEPMRKNLIEDTRILLNSLEKLVLTVEDSMMDVEFKKNESAKFIEYKFKIKKQENAFESCKQLKIC